ncbi:MAG: SpoIIE family protein phosphatase, partial [bacterium]|nr:SpoIIE family protein phosphatase [bacterium]
MIVKTAKYKKFGLLRYFFLTSLTAFVVVTVVLGQLYHQTIMRQLVDLGERKNVALAHAFAHSQWAQITSFMKSASELEGERLQQHPAILPFQESLLNQVHGSDVVEVKIYTLDGLTVFSSERAQIGQLQEENPGFIAARNAEILSSLITRKRFNALDRELKDRSLISSYIPLRRTPQSVKIDGVFELFSDVTPLLQQIKRAEIAVFGGIIAILAMLYLVLFLIVKRADTIIFRQSAELKKLSQAVEQSVNTTIITDIHGNIEYVNPKFTESTGYTQEEVIGKNPWVLEGREQDAGQDEELWGAISSGEAWHGEFRNIHRDGTVYWEQATISPMYDDDGRMTHFIEVKEDISERKRAERALKKSQEQLEASLEREMERRKLSETLRRVARIVGSTLEQECVVDLILGQLEYVVTYHRATVSLLEDHTLTLIAGRDTMGGEIDSYSFEADKYPINAQVLREKNPVLIPDVAQETRWHETPTMHGINSFISAPLLVQDEPIGLLAVGRGDEQPYSGEDAQTVFAFGTQVAIAMRNAQLHEELRARMVQELYMAQQIQKSLLPFDVPNIPGLDIAGFSQPAHEVGGDFYSFSVFDKQHLGIAVGDVSGKGMQAALMMSLSFGLLSTEVRHSVTPAALLDVMNSELRAHTQHHNMNTALGYVTLDKNGSDASGPWHLRAANAGLIAPLLRRKDGELEWLDVRGFPLGAVEDSQYSEQSHSLHAGDLLLLSSDGLVEAMNEAGELFGFERLTESLRKANG